MDENQNNDLLTIDEAMAYLKISRATLARRRYAQIPPRYVQIGTRVFYRKSDLEDFINASTIVGDTNE